MRGEGKASNHDEYMAELPDDQRNALQELRSVVRSTAPKAEECMSYHLPAFRLYGKVLVLFGAAATHCCFFPGSGTAVESHKDDLKGYNVSKGAIRFNPAKPLPLTIVCKIVRCRVATGARARHR